MNKDLDLTKILKDYPEGTKLYSPIFGDVEFLGVHNDGNYPIEVRLSDNALNSFTKDGIIFADYDGECTLFPSKDQRDWGLMIFIIHTLQSSTQVINIASPTTMIQNISQAHQMKHPNFTAIGRSRL